MRQDIGTSREQQVCWIEFSDFSRNRRTSLGSDIFSWNLDNSQELEDRYADELRLQQRLDAEKEDARIAAELQAQFEDDERFAAEESAREDAVGLIDWLIDWLIE